MDYSENDINHESNQTITEDSEENVASCNQFVKSSGMKQFQNTKQQTEKPFTEKLCLIKNMKESKNPPPIISEELSIDPCEENDCDNIRKNSCKSINNCLTSSRDGSNNQNNQSVDTLVKSHKGKGDSSFENLEKKSTVSCETSNECFKSKNSSENDINHESNQNITIEDSKENVASCKQFVKTSDMRQFQNTEQETEKSYIEKLCPIKDKAQKMKESENPPTIITEKLDKDSCEKNNCDNFRKNSYKPSINCFTSNTTGNNNQTNQTVHKRKRKKEEGNSTMSCKTDNKCFKSKKNSSKNYINQESNQNITKDSGENVASCKQLAKSSCMRQFQNTEQETEKSCIEKLCPVKDKAQNVKESENLTVITEESNKDSCKENDCDNFRKSACKPNNECLTSTTAGNNNQNNQGDILGKSHKRKQDSSFGNLGKNSTISCETINKCELSAEIYNPKSKKKKLEKSEFQNIKQLKCSIELNTLSQPHEMFNKSNHSPQKHLEISIPGNESVENICDKKNLNISSCSPYVKLKRLEDNIVVKYCEEIASEIDRKKSDFKNIPKESFETTSNICDNSLVQQQNSKNSICDSSSCLSPVYFPENVLSLELQDNEHILNTGNSSETESGMPVEHISKDKSLHVNIVKSVLLDVLEKCVNSDYSLHLNSNTYSNKNLNSPPFEIIPHSISGTNTSLDVKHSQPEIIPSREASKRLKIDDESSETKSSNNTEPIILGLTEEDTDFESDQDDVKHDDTFSNDRPNTPISSSLVQDYLNKMHPNISTLDTDTNYEENALKSSNGLQNNFSNLKKQEAYYSSDDDSDTDSDKEYSFKRLPTDERRTPLVPAPLEDVYAFEEIPSNLQDKVSENYESLATLSDETNLQSVTGKIFKQHESSLSADDQSICKLENDMATNSAKILPEPSLRLKEVKAQIKEYCCKEMAAKAVEVAQTYISISSTSDVSKVLFKKLLSGLFSFVMNSSNSEMSLSNIFDDVLKLMHKFEIYDKKISSYFIIKCCEHPELSSYARQIFDGCQEKKILLSNKAVNAFCSLLKPEELTISVLMEYIQYIKLVCYKNVPKNIIHSALEKSKTCKSFEIHRLFSILHSVTSKEVDELILKEFLQMCFKKSMWLCIAEMFVKWNTKNDLTTCIYLALVSESEFMAKYYGKFADYVHGDELKEMLYAEQKMMFGQIGIALMLEAFARKNLNCALEILNILHTYNVNYYELELAFCKFYFSQSFSDTDTFDVKTLPFLVVFIAVDICLHFERPKDAFTIFRDFSWITPDENLDQEIKMYVLKERYHRLIKLVPLLNDKDSLYQGWEALKILLAAVEQGLVQETLEEQSKVCTEENSVGAPVCTEESSMEAPDSKETTENTPCQFVHSIYNEYLISFINYTEMSSAFDLYRYSFGPKKDIFIVKPQVLRGLVVAFSNGGETEIAEAVFRHGLLTNVYPIKKPELSTIPWDLTIRSEWTVAEIKLVIDWFISMLSPLLSAKPKETNFEKWFSMKIVFRISNHLESKIKCLAESGSDPKYYVNKTKLALQNMNPSLQYIEEKGEEALLITSDSLYSYWKNKCSYDPPKLSPHFERSPVLRPKERRLSFGEISASSEKEKAMFNEKNCLQSTNKIQTHLAESLVSDYIDEIRSKTPAGTLVPVSPEISPNKVYQNGSNMSPEISFMSQAESSSFPFKIIQGNSQKLTDSINRTSYPSRFNKRYKIKRDPLDASNRDNIRSRSAVNINSSTHIPSISSDKSDSLNSKDTNIKVKKIYNLKNTAEINTLKLKNRDITNKIGKKSLQKSKKNNLSKQSTNEKVDIKNLTVSIASDSCTRIVSNKSQNLEKVSSKLETSQVLVKMSPQGSDLKKRINLNKSGAIFKNTAKRNLPNQSTDNVGSNLLVNVPVVNSNVNQTEQTLKEPLIVSVTSSDLLTKAPNSVSNVKIQSKIIPQNTDSDKVVSNNSAQCKIFKPVINRNLNSTLQLEDLNKPKIKIVPTTTSTSYITNSSPTKKHICMEKQKLIEQEVINCTKASKPFSGNRWNPKEFNKVIQFLQSKIAIKHKHLSPDQQQKKAKTLALTFIQDNKSITKLDPKAMKLLNNFKIQNI